MNAPGPLIGPTRPSSVVLAALIGAGVSWVGLQAMLFAGLSLPVVGPFSWLSVAALAAVMGWLAYTTYQVVQKRHEPLDPATAVARLQLGKTSVLAGVGLGAAYVVFALVASLGWPAPLAVGGLVHALIASLSCIAWAIAGWLLERSCRIPHDPDDTDDEPDE